MQEFLVLFLTFIKSEQVIAGIFIFSSLFKNESIFTPNVVTRCLNTYIFIKNKPENLKITTETQIDPHPLYFLLWYKSITFDTFVESPWALLQKWRERSLCHKLNFSNPFYLSIWSCKPNWHFKLILFDLTEFIVWNN